MAPSVGGEHISVDHIHVNYFNRSPFYWGTWHWHTQPGTNCGMRMTDQVDTPFTMYCDDNPGSPVITGTLTASHTGEWASCADATTWDIDIDFGNQIPNQSITTSGVCQLVGSFGSTWQNDGNTVITSTPTSPPPFSLRHPNGWYVLTQSGTMVTMDTLPVIAPVASFTCTPTSQYPDVSVVCTDASTGPPSDWYWSIDAEAMGIDGWLTNTSQNFTWSSHYPGLYSVNLRVNNTEGSDWENKTNYVSISDNATPNNCNIPVVPGLIRSWAQCVDSQTSGAVAGCDLSLYDLEGGAWSNITDRFDGTWCIDTYPGHHINAYGWADGYTPSPTYRLNLNANEHVVYELLMHPGYVPPAAEGKVWVYGIVNDADTGAAIEGATVRFDASGQTSKSDTTDASGSMHIQWINATQTTATASKAGYGTISKVFTTSDFGPDTVRIEIHRSTVTPTATATAGPGGTVPTTVNPNGPVNGVYPSDYTNTQGQAIMNLLAYHGYNLVLLCIFMTMLALLGFKLGK